MILSKAKADLIPGLIANAATIFNPAADSENVLVLFKNNVTVSKATVFADLVVADFDGSGGKVCAAGPAATGLNPVTGNYEIRPVEDVGGFDWKVTGTSDLPQTIYGVALLNAAMNAIVGVANLATPIALTAVDQVISYTDCVFTLPVNPLT